MEYSRKIHFSGAQNYGDNYVKAGQNTFYLKKFNVQGSNPYKHQYMSNVQGAASEAERLSKAYSSLKSSALEFQIPVFNNMPAQACSAPTGDGSPNNKLSGLSADGFSLTPSFSKDTTSYNLIVDTSVTQPSDQRYSSRPARHPLQVPEIQNLLVIPVILLLLLQLRMEAQGHTVST